MCSAVEVAWLAQNIRQSSSRIRQSSTRFPRDGQRTAVIGTDLIVEMTKKRMWPCRGTRLCFVVTQINHQYMKLTSPLLLNNQIFTLCADEYLHICADKWYNQLDAQSNIHSMIFPRLR